MRRWKRQLIVAALLTVLAVLALPATVANAARGVTTWTRRRSTMRKLVALAAIFALAVGAGTATLASASSTSAQQTITLVAVDLPKTERYIDAGTKGDSPGDTVFFQETLLQNGRSAGGSEVMCVFVSRNAGRCYGTLRLGSGTLEAAGGTRFGGRFSLPIVGGTGAYAGASGVLTVIAVSERRSRYEIELS
jgi:hypothetical protein